MMSNSKFIAYARKRTDKVNWKVFSESQGISAGTYAELISHLIKVSVKDNSYLVFSTYSDLAKQLRQLKNYQGGIHPSLYKYINFDSLAYMKDYMEDHETRIYQIEDGSKHVYVIKP